MTYYEIMTDTFEFRFGTSKTSIPAMSGEEVVDSYMEMEYGKSYDPQCVARFADKDEALAEFNSHYSDYGRTYAQESNVFWLLRGEIAWLEENDYTLDNDGEEVFDQGGGVLAFSAQGYEPEE